MVNFVLRGKSIIYAIPTNKGYFGTLVESRIF